MNIPTLIEHNDIDELVREIDRLCLGRRWSELLDLRDRCRSAAERGKTLWGVAGHAEYRLALEAPAPFAASMAHAEPGPFVLGPLPEVIAARHSWDELAEQLDDSPQAAAIAYERVIHGESIWDGEQWEAQFGLPLELQSWEPAYTVAKYSAHDALYEPPLLEIIEQVDLTPNSTADDVEDVETKTAFHDLTRQWTAHSNGVAKLRLLEGTADGIGRPRLQRLTAESALAWLGWVGANGGAHGQRAGAATGRSALWALLATAADVNSAWPYDADAIGAFATTEVQWFTWDTSDGINGWELRLVMVDPVDLLTYVFEATDQANSASDE